MNATEHCTLLHFLNTEQERFERDVISPCLFPVNVTKAAALSRAKTLYELERRLKFDGPFTKAYVMKSGHLISRETREAC